MDDLLHFYKFQVNLDFLETLSDLGEGASKVTMAMIAKSMFTKLIVDGDYKDFATNLAVMNIGSLCSELSEQGIRFATKLIEEGERVLGNILKVGAPFLSRGS